MRFQKIVSGFLACAMAVASVAVGDMATVNAAEQPAPVASYDFNDGALPAGAKAVSVAMGNYSGAAAFEAGRNGEGDQAIKLGNYGLQLAEKNIGSKYTVSFWVKPDGKIAGNSAVAFLGYNTPELWTAIAGEDGNNTCKTWLKGGSFSHTTVGTLSVPAQEWTMLTMTYADGKLKVYQDGVLAVAGDAPAALDGANQGIAFGSTFWPADPLFSGLIDDVSVYDQDLSAVQIRYLFDQKSADQVFDEQLANLTDAVIKGKNESLADVKYDLSLPQTQNGFALAWSAKPEGIVMPNGEVKNPAADTDVVLTATISSGAESKTKEFALKVKSAGKAELDSLLAQAKNELSSAYITEASRKALQEVIDKAAEATTQEEIDIAVSNIQRALRKISYTNADYKDPLALIDEKNLSTSMDLKLNEKKQAFQVPAAIKDMVTVTYVSSKPEVASVDASGVVTAKSVGYTKVTAAVTAKYDGFSMEYQTLVKVTAEPTFTSQNVTATAKAAKLAKGGSTQIVLGNVPSGAQVIWDRAKGSVSVDKKTGKVTGKKAGAGTVTVKVKAGGKTVTKKVKFQVGDITGAATVKAKKSITLKVTGLSGKVKWSVDKKKLATISSKGKLKAKKAGKVTVTAKVGNVTMKKKVTIKK